MKLQLEIEVPNGSDINISTIADILNTEGYMPAKVKPIQPFEMPSDDEIKQHFLKTYPDSFFHTMSTNDIIIIIKQALQYFINKKEGE